MVWLIVLAFLFCSSVHGHALHIMADHIWEAESETSLPDDREESEISLPASDRCPDLGEDKDDDKDYLQQHLPPDDDHESSDESEIDLPDDEKVTQCCAKRCTNNSETQEHKDFLFRLRGVGASDHEQRVYNLILEKAETKVKLGKY